MLSPVILHRGLKNRKETLSQRDRAQYLMIVFYLPVMVLYDRNLALAATILAAVNGLALTAVGRFRKDANLKFAQEQGKLFGTTVYGLALIESLSRSRPPERRYRR